MCWNHIEQSFHRMRLLGLGPLYPSKEWADSDMGCHYRMDALHGSSQDGCYVDHMTHEEKEVRNRTVHQEVRLMISIFRCLRKLPDRQSRRGLEESPLGDLMLCKERWDYVLKVTGKYILVCKTCSNVWHMYLFNCCHLLISITHGCNP